MDKCIGAMIRDARKLLGTRWWKMWTLDWKLWGRKYENGMSRNWACHGMLVVVVVVVV